MPAASQSCVMLQRVPPDIKILTPGLRFFSNSSVRRPRSALRVAANKPGRTRTDDDHFARDWPNCERAVIE